MSTSPASLPQPGPASPALGRPTKLDAQIIDGLCAIIRQTGVSDSAAAAQLSLHPSTISRWKRDYIDFAILLRSAREGFRQAHLDIILRTAEAGGATGLRASMWVLERIFPQDYAPRAAERARYQEMYDAACGSESEGSEIESLAFEEPLQNVQKSAPSAVKQPAIDAELASLSLPLGDLPALRDLRGPLQNVQKSTLAGRVAPPKVLKVA